jgi:penicillin G amidase
MKLLRFLLSGLLTLGLVVALNRPWGTVPAFGPLLSPFTGFWQNAESRINPADETLNLGGTQQPVTVVFDDLRIPHVFAQNDHDVYFAQGYLTARDRLWQMEFQTHAAAGRLSELIGERALELDRFNRRLGMGYGAEIEIKTMLANPKSREVIEAYTAGVNAWISRLTPAQYPIEYKLLGYAPELWTPLKCALLQKQMTNTLALGADDLMMSNIRTAFGEAVSQDLFPDYPTRESPIIPSGTRWEFTPLKSPAVPAQVTDRTDGAATEKLALRWPQHDPAIGSNNWAVSGQKSASGYPILANDPHLTLSLPSIWYQMQMTTPTMNVYGATLPGAPHVIIGFNQRVAWGVTNVGADVLDFYRIRFKDAARTEYWHDNRWKPVTRRIEVIKIKGQPDRRDTVLYTHHGPVMYTEGMKGFKPNIPVGYAARWIAHEPADDSHCFYLLNRAKNYADYLTALSYYVAPAQNFVFADANKDIAISPNGKFPLKWKDQGKYLLDGSNPAHDWQGWIPADHNPRVKNPARGFVSSANQSSTDPTYPYYINWAFAPYERGLRINDRLTAMQRATPDSLRALQNDLLNLRAVNTLPTWLPKLDRQKLSDPAKQAVADLERWNRQNTADSPAPTVFGEWTRRFQMAVWDDQFSRADSVNRQYPSFERLLHLTETDTASRWYDDVRTPARETLRAQLTASLNTTMDSLTVKHGPYGPAWAWSLTKKTGIRHLIPGLDAFSVLNINTGGGNVIVNATTERTGPSWRMVVALGPEPKAYGLYPGGQSGNPGSPYYADMIEKWVKGELNELLFLKTPADKNARIRSRTTLR